MIFDFGKLGYNNNNNNNNNNKKAGLLGYPIRVILLVIFFGEKRYGKIRVLLVLFFWKKKGKK